MLSIVRYSGSGVAEGPLATTGYTVVEQFVIAAASGHNSGYHSPIVLHLNDIKIFKKIP